MRILDADGVEIKAGDMVACTPGFGDSLLSMQRQPDVKALQESGSGLNWQRRHAAELDRRCAPGLLIADIPAVELLSHGLAPDWWYRWP